MRRVIRVWPRSLATSTFIHVFLGLPMAAAGVGALAAPDTALLARLGFAAMFFAVAAIVSVRHEIRYWPAPATIETVWSLVFPLRRRVYPLSAFANVAVRAAESLGTEFSTTTQTSYRVELAGPAETLQIDSFGDPTQAVAEANRVSAIVHLPVTPGPTDAIAIEPYDWGPPQSARFTVAFGAGLTAAGLALIGLMFWLSDWTRWIPVPFLLFFLFWGVTLLWMGLARGRESRADR